jgi:hypothetical protein
VTYVRAERVHRPFVAVEGERVGPAARPLAPEGLVEAAGELGRLLLEPGRERFVRPYGPRQLRRPPFGVIDVALGLADGDRTAGEGPVVEDHRDGGVLPALILESALGSHLVLDEAVAVPVAVAIDPLQRAEGGPSQLRHELRVAGPAPELREQYEPQRCRVDRAVVDRKPRVCSAAPADLVEDLPGLGVEAGVVGSRLEGRERAQRIPRQLGSDQEGLVARDQGIAAEERHEPGRSGGDEVPRRALEAAEAERAEIGDRALVRALDVGSGRREVGRLFPPGGERDLPGGRLLPGEPHRGGRIDGGPVGRRPNDDVDRPLLARLESEGEPGVTALDGPRPREEDERSASVAVHRLQLESLFPLVVGGARLGRDRPRPDPQVVLALLAREDVREVGAEREPEVELDDALSVVPYDDALLEAADDDACARDRDLVGGEPARHRIPEHERHRVVLGAAGREEPRRRPVHGQLEAGKEAGVLGEQPQAGGVDVAAVVGDAEGGALQHGHGHGGAA